MMEPAALYLRLSQEDGERWGVSEHFQSEDLFNPVLSGERLHGGGMLH